MTAGGNPNGEAAESAGGAAKSAARDGAKDAGAFRTIGEVARELGVSQHMLRFWQTRFPELNPIQRGGNRRYYRPADVLLVAAIDRLLHREGYTIRGIRKLLADHGVRGVIGLARVADGPEAKDAAARQGAAGHHDTPPGKGSAAPRTAGAPAGAPPLAAEARADLQRIRDLLARALAA